MLAHTKKVLEYNGGSIAINPRFDKLITSLRTAVENGEGLLEKEATSYNINYHNWFVSSVTNNITICRSRIFFCMYNIDLDIE